MRDLYQAAPDWGAGADPASHELLADTLWGEGLSASDSHPWDRGGAWQSALKHRWGHPLPTGWVGVIIMWLAETEVMVCRLLTRVWQHVKLSDAGLWTRPLYSLVAGEDVKKPTKQTNIGDTTYAKYLLQVKPELASDKIKKKILSKFL